LGSRGFAGSLDDKKAARGVLLTTARFTRAAADFVRGIPGPAAAVIEEEIERWAPITRAAGLVGVGA
jgi:hypothetical protein